MSNSTKTVRAGIVGSGFAARFHIEAIRKVYGVQAEIVGVYSPTEQNCLKFAEDNSLKPFSSLASLITESDVIHVCTPPSTHEDIGIEALKQDKYVIIEKPFTGYFGQGDEQFSGDIPLPVSFTFKRISFSPCSAMTLIPPLVVCFIAF